MNSWAEYLQNCVENYYIITIYFSNTDEINIGKDSISPENVYCGEHCLIIDDINKQIDYPYHSIVKIIKYGRKM